jgi:hypothetical protein
MRHLVPRALAALACAVVACSDQTNPTSVLAPSSGPERITNGTPTGSLYSNVGNLFVDANNDGVWGPGDWRCTGTLISPTVFLTAGHCYDTGVTYYVTFDPVALPAPPNLPASSLPSSTTAYRHPDYQPPYFDLAVIILPASAISPMPLAAEGYLTELRSEPAWGQKTATVVGYGLASYGQGSYVTQNDGVRRYAELKVQSLDAYFLILRNAAPKAGKPGVCYGDSGGPVIVDGYLVAVASFVGPDLGCHSYSGFFRTDIAGSLDWLSNFVAPE